MTIYTADVAAQQEPHERGVDVATTPISYLGTQIVNPAPVVRLLGSHYVPFTLLLRCLKGLFALIPRSHCRHYTVTRIMTLAMHLGSCSDVCNGLVMCFVKMTRSRNVLCQNETSW